MEKFLYYFNDMSEDDLAGLSPIDRKNREDDAKVKYGACKKYIEGMIQKFNNTISDRLQRIEKLRAEFCVGNSNAMTKIVELRAEIDVLVEQRPYLEAELKELFSE
jgi:hypothetical protein